LQRAASWRWAAGFAERDLWNVVGEAFNSDRLDAGKSHYLGPLLNVVSNHLGKLGRRDRMDGQT
jgi:hypothetical protein